MFEHVEQHVFVLRGDPQRRQSAAQRQVEQVVPAIAGLLDEGGLRGGIARLAASRRRVRHVPVPNPQPERSAVNGSAEAVVDRRVGGDDRRQVRRPPHRRQVLRGADVGTTHHADLAVRPGLPGEPLDRVVAVLAVVGHPVPDSLGSSPAARILTDDDVTARNKVFRRGNRSPLSVRGAAEYDRESAFHRGAVSGGQVDVRRQLDAVAQRNHHVLASDHFVWRVPAERRAHLPRQGARYGNQTHDHPRRAKLARHGRHSFWRQVFRSGSTRTVQLDRLAQV